MGGHRGRRKVLTVLDFGHINVTPGLDIQTFVGQSTTTLITWQTWRKPRGAKMVYMLAVGGGSSGGTGVNTAVSSGGGAGGGTGGQSSLLIPAMFLPDVLYIQAGQGGAPIITSGGVGAIGTPTYVTIEAANAVIAQATVLFATAGPVTGAAATASAGGVAGSAAAVATLANMPLGARGQSTLLAGQAGSAGGSGVPAIGGTVTIPLTGLIVTGGTGGGGANASVATGSNGGPINLTTAMLGTEFFSSLIGGVGSATSTPSLPGMPGYSAKNFMMNYGGTGGGGTSNTAGGNAGAGGDAAPGSGGGGAGAPTTTNTTVPRSGAGGPGFVIIISF